MTENKCKETVVIGLDWATQENARGLALGCVDAGGCLRVHEVKRASEKEPAKRTVKEWLAISPSALICIDAPLGWPERLPRELGPHKAGQAIDADPGMMFSRYTDCCVTTHIGREPLEVGANFIARTALSAVQFLGELRGRVSTSFPLVWKPEEIEKPSVIEVYPAGTLCAWGKDPSGYKGSGNERKKEETRLKREKISGWLIEKTTGLKEDFKKANGHLVDAVLCLLAGRDFLAGECLNPPHGGSRLIKKEGWIWVRRPELAPGDNPCKKAKDTPS